MKTVLQQWLWLAVLLILGMPHPVTAAPGDLDSTFNADGKVVTRVSTGDDLAWTMVMQDDGKILVVGEAANTGGTGVALVRYTGNGALDGDFGNGGKVITELGSVNDHGRAVALQPDSKIVVAGDNDSSELVVLRYNRSGALDSTFGTDGKVMTRFDGSLANIGCAVAVQADGKILAAGYSHFGGNWFTDFTLARYHSDGSLDTSFGTGGKVVTDFDSGSDNGYAMAVQPDGKILVAGECHHQAYLPTDFAVARYLTNGALDPGFGTGGKVVVNFLDFDTAYDIALLPDDKILLAGRASDGSTSNFALARLYASGTLDTSFGTAGKVTTPFDGHYWSIGYSATLQGDGKIVLAGKASSGTGADVALARYEANGALDTTFGTGGKVTTALGGVYWQQPSIAMQGASRILLADTTYNGTNYDFALLRYFAVSVPITSRFSAPLYVANESASSAIITVERFDSIRDPLTVTYATSDGTATAGADYVATAGTLVFAPGQRRKTFRVPLLRDQIANGCETVNLTLMSSPDANSIGASVLVLREMPLAISPRKLRPGQRATVLGRFDPTLPLHIRFCDFAGNDTVVRASNVTARSAKVRVPVFFDPATLGPDAAVMTVQAQQGAACAGPVMNVSVSRPALTGVTPGAFTLEFLKLTAEVLALAEQHWEAIENQSEGYVSTGALRADLHEMHARIQDMASELQVVVDGSSDHLDLGTIGTDMLTLNSTGLAALDRMLLAAVFEGRFKPVTSSGARLHALAESHAPAAPVEPDPIGDFHDELNPTLREKIAEIFGMANKSHEMAKTHVGKAFECAEEYLGVPGEVLEPWKEIFSATNYFATVVGPSVMGMAALSMAEPFIENELHRPVTIEDYQPALDYLQQGSKEFLEDHKDRLIAKLEEVLAGRGGNLLDFVKKFDSLTDAVGKAIDVQDEDSVIENAFEVADVIYENRPKPTASIDDVTVTEPASGSRNAAFLVSLDRVFDQAVTVSFATAPGSAGAGDFTPRSGTVTIPKGSRARFITVAVRSDSVDEQTETFFVNLTGAMNAALGKATGQCTILDKRRHWSLSATVSVAGNDYQLAEDFSLPRSGGTRTFSLAGIATAKVVVTASKMTVSGSGFRVENATTVKGSASGSSPIVDGPTQVSAAGPISGTLHVIFQDGSSDDYPITGSFAATGTK